MCSVQRRCCTSSRVVAPGRSFATHAVSGKVALVTGSTSGIGLGIAVGLARRGAAVMLNGFGDPSAALAAVRSAAGPSGAARVDFCDADLSTERGVESLVTRTRQQLGSVDILVNNAGIQSVHPVESFPVDRWNAVLAVNLSAVFHGTRLVLPEMTARGWGRIVNIASVHGLVASAHKAAYVAAKHGVIGLTKTVALECATHGVTCTAVCPGWVRTPLVEAQIAARAKASGRTLEEEQKLLISEKMPSGTFVEVEHLAEAVLFLCSDAAAQINGTALLMDGGWTSQ